MARLRAVPRLRGIATGQCSADLWEELPQHAGLDTAKRKLHSLERRRYQTLRYSKSADACGFDTGGHSYQVLASIAAICSFEKDNGPSIGGLPGTCTNIPMSVGAIA
jgi:hypothetical protein